jgi:hypothetical protein
VTNPDRHTDLNPTPTATGNREQGHADTGQQVGGRAKTGTSPDAKSSDTATNAHATDIRAPGTPANDTPANDTSATDTGAAAPSGGRDEPDKGTRKPLVPQQRAAAYSERWDQVKGGFVDEPRQAVAAADQLVSELLEELQELFRSQRHDIEQSLDADATTTEDLRVALRRYRNFFDRLLAV